MNLTYFTPATLAAMAADIRVYQRLWSPDSSNRFDVAEAAALKERFLLIHAALLSHVGADEAAELIDAAEKFNHAETAR